MEKIAIHTVGCKLNYTESSAIANQFEKRGYTIVGNDQPADIVILNTCTVTERASRKCRQLIRSIKRSNPEAYLAVVGCYSQVHPSEISSIDGVDLILGSNDKFKIFSCVRDFKKNGQRKIFVNNIENDLEFIPAVALGTHGRTRAFVKIQDGCDFKCAYCIVPLARGKSRSLSIEEVVNEVEQVVEHGFKEIVLTGVNIGDYGKGQNTNLLMLLKELNNNKCPERIRLSSIEPNLLDTDLIDYILGSQRICNHFHIPLQSGSDVILKKMGRSYLKRDFQEIVELIKRKDNEAAIGVDIITGFPGETDELFEETFNFLKDLPISYFHVFPYSERQNTPAVNYEGKVKPLVRYERAKKLRELSLRKKREFYSSFIGKDISVLFEGKRNGEFFTGLTRNYIRVEASSNCDLTNLIKDVKVIEINGGICVGKINN